jgi:hypothetical protein
MKKTSASCFNNKLNYQDILSNLILTAFTKELKYDYYIPAADCVLNIVYNSLEQWKTKSKIKKDIFEIVEENYSTDGCSILRRYLWDDTVFGHEWFCGRGDFYRYRKEKKAEALSEIYSHPKLSDVINISDKVRRCYLKKEVESFLYILNKEINSFYEKWDKEKNSKK